MQCPFCGANDDKVIDSRSSEGGLAVRRRRQCLKCRRRFTTYERVEETLRQPQLPLSQLQAWLTVRRTIQPSLPGPIPKQHI